MLIVIIRHYRHGNTEEGRRVKKEKVEKLVIKERNSVLDCVIEICVFSFQCGNYFCS